MSGVWHRMSPDLIVVRRATLDDMTQLVALWQSMNLDPGPLARRVTEFQVAELRDGTFLGAIGLQIIDKQGCLHSEGFTDFAYAEQARAALWERFHALAANYRLWRLWTLEQAPFWKRCGMTRAAREDFESLPASWRKGGEWMTIKLREDVDKLLATDAEFALFMQAEKAKTALALKRGRILKVLVGVLTLVILGAALAAAFLLVQRSRTLGGFGR